MLNDVMTLAEASVIWRVEYEGLVNCICARPYGTMIYLFLLVMPFQPGFLWRFFLKK